MQVRRVWSRAARSLLAQRTRTVTGDGLRKVWRWSLGAEPNDTVLQARQYLAADLDVEAIHLDTSNYDATGIRTRAGMWEPDEESYDPHGLAKQRIITSPSLGVEVRLAVSATWMDRARRGQALAVKLVGKTRATAAPLARKGYRIARDRVSREQAVKHLRRAPAPAPDQSGTYTVQASLTFTPEQNARWEGVREQLVRAGVLVGEIDDIPTAEADSGERKSEQPSRRRCIDPDNTVHLAHPFLAVPLCGRPLRHDERGKKGGARVFFSTDAETMPYDSRMCEFCARMSAALREPPVDPELWRSAPSRKWEENNQLFSEGLSDRTSWAFKDGPRVAQQDAPGIPDETDRESMGEALQDALYSYSTASCPGCSRAYGTAGVTCHRTPADGWVCEIAIKDHPLTQAEPDFEALRGLARVVDREAVLHLTSEPFPASLAKVVPHCGRKLEIASGARYFEALIRRGDPTPAGAESICAVCLEARGLDPEPGAETRADASSELDDGDEMPVLKVAYDGRVYLPKLMVEAGMVTSQKNGARLINSGQVTIDGKPCIGKLTFNPIELVGFVVELGGRNTTGSLPRIYESMTRRFRVLMA